MRYTRTIRVEYFEVVCRKMKEETGSPDTPFDFNRWIDKADKLTLDQRVYEYYQDWARLDKIFYREESNYWFLNFIRLRETNIPSTAKLDRVSEPLTLEEDEYIGEEVTILYDEDIYVLALQRNRYSLGVSGIEEYINRLWDSNEERIYLRPILPLELQKKIFKTNIYRRLIIRFADVNSKELKGDSKKPLIRLYNDIKKYNAVTAEISIGMGYNYGEHLDMETIRDTIYGVMENKDIISKAQLKIKENEDTSVETIDLFSDKLYDFISIPIKERTSLTSQNIEPYMLDRYNVSKDRIRQALRRRELE